jgi:hypothetical protein
VDSHTLNTAKKIEERDEDDLNTTQRMDEEWFKISELNERISWDKKRYLLNLSQIVDLRLI